MVWFSELCHGGNQKLCEFLFDSFGFSLDSLGRQKLIHWSGHFSQLCVFFRFWQIITSKHEPFRWDHPVLVISVSISAFSFKIHPVWIIQYELNYFVWFNCLSSSLQLLEVHSVPIHCFRLLWNLFPTTPLCPPPLWIETIIRDILYVGWFVWIVIFLFLVFFLFRLNRVYQSQCALMSFSETKQQQKQFAEQNQKMGFLLIIFFCVNIRRELLILLSFCLFEWLKIY